MKDQSEDRPATHCRLKKRRQLIKAPLTFLGWLSVMAPLAPQAATIWNGTPITFTKVAGTDPTLPANQDRITGNVWITRGGGQGIYNAKTEPAFTHFSSPADTEWADGTTAQYATLSYANWNQWAKGVHPGPPSTVGVNAVVHLISDDIYIDIKFTSWASLPSFAAFSYQRATPAVSVNLPPSVTITNPANGAVLSAPATITLRATATDSDGSVTNVQFLQGTTSLGNVASGLYNFPVNNLGAGDYSFSAIATDNGGLTATNSITIHVVTPAPLNLGLLPHGAGSFQFSYSANPGLRYLIQRSVDLRNWIPVQTNTAASTTEVYSDDTAAGSLGLYRVGRLPNP